MTEMIVEMRRGGSIETQICQILRERTVALSPKEIASLSGRDVKEVYAALEAMYWASKLEKKQGKPPIYRLPGKDDGKLSLPN